MKEQTVLQCARCLTHTTLIETESQESILEAVAANASCKNCGWHVMLCFDSRIVITGMLWRKYYASKTRIIPRKHGRTNSPSKRGQVAARRAVQEVR